MRAEKTLMMEYLTETYDARDIDTKVLKRGYNTQTKIKYMFKIDD